MKLFTKLLTIGALGLTLSGCSEIQEATNNQTTDYSTEIKDATTNLKDKASSWWDTLMNGATDSNTSTSADTSTSDDTNTQSSDSTQSADFTAVVEELSMKDFVSGSSLIEEVNGGQSTLDASTWDTSHIVYSDLDSLNRVGTATAYLDSSNYGKSSGRTSQKWLPTGWKQKKGSNGVEILNRGHLIAYTITFNLDDQGNYVEGEDGSLDNPKNLFTQTARSNQVEFQKYEEMVRDSIKDGHKVIYRVQPVFRGDELMARGTWLQAVSDDGSLNFSVYIYNVQPGFVFNYADGSSKVDDSMTIKK